MAKISKTEEGGSPKKYLLKKLEKVHNCYSDLKNQWEENAFDKEDEVQKLVCTAILVFLLGFLLSQISIYLYKHPSAQTEIETLKPKTQTIYQWNVEEFIDYASDTNGGVILSEYSTPEYLGWFYIFSQNRQEALISNNNEPGNCWPFNGTYGYIGIQLGQSIYPKHFSIFHINSLSYSSAPKNIKVYSLDHPSETVLLASYFFDLTIKGEKRQNSGFFECEFECEKPLSRVLLEVNDNYGGNGTCVYQFKVHGIPYI